MAFVHCLDDASTDPAVLPNGSGLRYHLHWNTESSGDPLESEASDPYWIISHSTSTGVVTSAVATYSSDPSSLQPVVELREDAEDGSPRSIRCALRGHGTTAGWGVCPPGSNDALRYDLRFPVTSAFGKPMASVTGDLAFTLDDFIEYYGPYGANAFRNAPIASTPVRDMPLGPVLVHGAAVSVPSWAAVRLLTETEGPLAALSGHGQAQISTNAEDNDGSFFTVRVDIALHNLPTTPEPLGSVHQAIWEICQALDEYCGPGQFTPMWPSASSS